ncbi:MAG: hypothetical protein ABI811_12270 [Acidobacteriota bacterium]
MKAELIERYTAIQTAIKADALKHSFEADDVASLNVIIRLTVEFADYLDHVDRGIPWLPDRHENSKLSDHLKKVNDLLDIFHSQNPEIPDRGSTPEFEASYAAGSIFAGLQSFYTLHQTYGCLTDQLPATIGLPQLQGVDVKKEFTARYREFLTATGFSQRCRLLLDMYRLQIVFAGLAHS